MKIIKNDKGIFIKGDFKKSWEDVILYFKSQGLTRYASVLDGWEYFVDLYGNMYSITEYGINAIKSLLKKGKSFFKYAGNLMDDEDLIQYKDEFFTGTWRDVER
jgi:hypothetical protein